MRRYFFDTFDDLDQDSTHRPASPVEESYWTDLERAHDEAHTNFGGGGFRTREPDVLLELEDEAA